MARILSKFEPRDIEQLVTLGEFSRPEYSAFLTEVLEQRLRRAGYAHRVVNGGVSGDTTAAALRRMAEQREARGERVCGGPSPAL